ncbi:probable protein phosphatase 2C 78 [Dendrobium catenatum]|uniref:probable protein phosphatase 2C 78 n=1 Tax=Dendrobium catenatum TaxID=906689 RepID=UPI0009F53E10|nr:probable protein phosphatase 2C 78 [Dendrobium catenatum]
MSRCCGLFCSDDELQWHLALKTHNYGDFSFAISQANSQFEDQGQVFNTPYATFIGVYDGHGGPDASRFLNSRMFSNLHRFVTEDGGVSIEVIKKAFRASEEEFLQMVGRSWQSCPHFVSVGSCCLVGVIVEDMLYLGNLGDSRAVLGRNRIPGENEVVAERLTSDHNVMDEEVRNEVINQHPDDSRILVHIRGAWRIKGIIQVSRTIGDYYLKNPEFSRSPLYQQLFPSATPFNRPVITSEPSVGRRRLRPHDLFVIFASDGLWEQLSDEAAVKMVTRNPRAGIAKRLVRAALNEAAKKRNMSYGSLKGTPKGERRQIHDDITVIVIYLDHHFTGENFHCTNAPVDMFSHEPQDYGDGFFP